MSNIFKSESLMVKEQDSWLSFSKKLTVNLFDNCISFTKGSKKSLVFRFHLNDIKVKGKSNRLFVVESVHKTLAIQAKSEQNRNDWVNEMFL